MTTKGNIKLYKKKHVNPGAVSLDIFAKSNIDQRVKTEHLLF